MAYGSKINKNQNEKATYELVYEVGEHLKRKSNETKKTMLTKHTKKIQKGTELQN